MFSEHLPVLGARDAVLSREDSCGVAEMLEKLPYCYDDQNMLERRSMALGTGQRSDFGVLSPHMSSACSQV